MQIFKICVEKRFKNSLRGGIINPQMPFIFGKNISLIFKKILILGVFVFAFFFYSSSHAFAATKYPTTTGGNWSADATWTLNANGTANATVAPTASDDVIFNGTSGNVTVDTTTAVAKTLDMATYSSSGTLTITNSMKLSVSGNVTLASGKFTAGGNTAELAMLSTGTILTTGNTLGKLTLNGSGQTFTLGDSLTTYDLNLTAGTLITGAYTHNLGRLLSSNTNTRTLNISNSTINVTNLSASGAIWYLFDTTNLTFSTNSSTTINISGNNTPGFYGGGLTYLGTVTFTTSSSGVPLINGANTYRNFSFASIGSGAGYYKIDGGATITNTFTINAPNRVKITSGNIISMGSASGIVATGSAGNLIDIDTVTGTGTWTITRPSGTQKFDLDYLTLNRSAATQTNTFYASHTTDTGTNTNWIFANKPDAPTGLAGAQGNTQIFLSWTAPANNGDPITDYVVDYKLNSEPTVWSTFADGVSALTTATVTGLTNGLVYNFRVSAVNGAGQGSASATASATPGPVKYARSTGGNWSADSTWSTSPGGPADTTAPTATDDVIFDVNSGNVTVDTTTTVAKTLNMTGSAGTLTITNAMKLSVSGNVTLASGKFSAGGDTANLTMLATGTLTTVGNTMGALTFNGTSQTFTLGDGVSTRNNAIVLFSEGTLIGGSFTHNFGIFQSNVNKTRILNLSGTTLNLISTSTGYYFVLTNPNLTVTTNASTVIDFQGGTITHSAKFGTESQSIAYNGTVKFSGTGNIFSILDSTDSYSLTFHNLTIDQSTITTSGNLFFDKNISIDSTGVLTLKGGADNRYRFLVQSGTLGTRRTFTLNSGATTSMQRVDFRDVGFGSSLDLSSYTTVPGGAGDAGGNNNIIFPSSRNLYWYTSSSGTKLWSNTSGATNWYTTDGVPPVNAIATDDSPLPQDNVFINAHSLGASATISLDVSRAGANIDWTGSTTTYVPTWSFANDFTMYGSLTMVSGMNLTNGNKILTLEGRLAGMPVGGWTITSAGKTFYGVAINSSGGTYILQDNLTLASTFTNSAGTFTANDKNITANNFSITSGTINMGSGIWKTTVTAAGSLWSNNSGTVINCNTSTLEFSGNSTNTTRSFGAMAGTTFYNINFSGQTTAPAQWNLPNNFTVNGTFTMAAPNRIRVGTGKTITMGPSSNIVAVGSLGNLIDLDTVLGTGTWTITRPSGTNVFALDWLTLNRSVATQTNTFFAGINTTDTGTNTNWIFASVPNAPTDLVATYGNTQVSLSWTAPGNNGSVITDYALGYKLASEPTVWSIFADGTSPLTTGVVTGLTNGLSYNFRVSAINAVGQGPVSGIAVATPMTIPGAPTIGTATPGNAQVSVTFTPPASNGGSTITGYTVTSSPGSITGTGSGSPIVVSGLTNGTSYTFTVTATNVVGPSSPSAPSNSATPRTVPNAPTALGTTPGNTQASLFWSAPAFDGGSAIADYVIEYQLTTGGTWAVFADGTSTNTTGIVTGLTNGLSYDFRVSAVNIAGQGTASSTAIAIPITVPGAPTNAVATRGNTQASVAFIPPSIPWYNANWTYRKKITIDHTKVPNISQSNFPVLVSLSGLSNINALGTDIRFTSFNGTTELAREIESYSSGALVSWVKVPILSTSADTIIYMYYGNGGATEPVASSTYGSQKVWDDGGNNYFQGVWHSQDASSTTILDSTINEKIGTKKAVGEPAEISGQINKGQNYDGINDYINISSAFSGLTTDSTFSGWIKLSGLDTNGSVLLGSNTGNNINVWQIGNSTTFWIGGSSSVSITSTPFTDNTWRYITATQSGTLLKVYINGNEVGSANGAGMTWPTGTKNFTLGDWIGSSGTNWSTKGIIDEVRVSNTARSQDWIKTEYYNQNSPSTFYTVASEENISSPNPDNGGSPITSYTATSNPGSFTGVGSASPVIVSGLTNGTPYTFTVTATNLAGTGLASVPSNSVTPATVPDAPTLPIATAGNAQVSLSWTAPVNNGGSDVIDYVIEYKLSSSETWLVFGEPISPDLSRIVTGLTNGLSYNFRIKAVNDVGPGSASATASAMPVTVPDPPTAVSAIPGNAQATVSFIAPLFDGGSTINSYTVTSSPGNISNTGNASPILVTGLTNGVQYTFTVIATNAVGPSIASDPSLPVTPVTIPNAPTGVTAVPGNSQATISFISPAFDGGTPITSYTATSSPGSFTGTSSGSPIVVTGLTNGLSYTFTVVATNIVGPSLPSSSSNSVTLSTEPGQPINLASSVLGSSIGLSWSAPISDGGSAITDYVIEYQLTTGGTWAVFADGINTSTTATVVGLSNGTSYDFRVKAVNIIGQSVPSAIVSASPGEPAQVFIQGFSDTTVSSIGTNIKITNEGTISYEYQYTWCVTDSDTNLCGGGDDIFSSTAAKLLASHENWETTLNSTVLSPGNYYFHIKVFYGSSSSRADQSFTALATFPEAPTLPVATAGNAQASISFTLPTFDGGSVITGYTVSSNTGGITATGISSPIIVTGLTNGVSYFFTVTATNIMGTSPSSTPSNSIIPVTVPDSPTIISATAGSNQVTLEWTAPINDGGTPITDYVVEYKLITDATWLVFADGISTTTSAIVTGLTNNLTYDFRVSAVNLVGQSLINSINATLPANTQIETGTGRRGGGGYIPPVQPPATTEIPPTQIVPIEAPTKEVVKDATHSTGSTSSPQANSNKTKITKTPTKNIEGPTKTPPTSLGETQTPEIIPPTIIKKNEAQVTPIENPKVPIFPEMKIDPLIKKIILQVIAILGALAILGGGIIIFIKRRRKFNLYETGIPDTFEELLKEKNEKPKIKRKI